MGAQGTATVDFGSTPSSEAAIAVTGQTGFAADSLAEAWIQQDTTAGNDAIAHKALWFLAKCYTDTPVAGTGFTVRALLANGLATGTFDIKWVWN